MKRRLPIPCCACVSLATLASLTFGTPLPERPPREKVSINGHKGTVYAVVFSPDGKLLASGGHDHMIKLWDAASGKERATLRGHTDAVIALAFSPDGRLLASTSRDHSLRLWDVPGSKALPPLATRGEGHPILTFSPDGKMLVTGPAANCTFWDVKARKVVKKREKTLSGSAYSLAYAKDGKLLCTAWAPRRQVAVWDIEEGEWLHALQLPAAAVDPWSAVLSPDHKFLAAARNGVYVWNVATGKLLAATDRPKDVGTLAFSPNSKLLAAGWKTDTGPYEGIVSVLDPSTGKELAALRGHRYGLGGLAFSPDGRTLAVGTGYEVIKLWDVGSLQATGR